MFEVHVLKCPTDKQNNCLQLQSFASFCYRGNKLGSLCMYCEGGGELKCPGESYQKNGLHVYEAFPQNVTLFCDPGALPFDMDLKDQYMAEEYLRNHVK